MGTTQNFISVPSHTLPVPVTAFYFPNTFSWYAKLGSFEEWYFPVAFQSGPQGSCAVGQKGREKEKSLSLWHFNDMYPAQCCSTDSEQGSGPQYLPACP